MLKPAQRAAHQLGGRFVIERQVGRGASGVVYRAFDELSREHVALKVIAGRGGDPEEEARFEREGTILAGLDHPNIVRVVAFGTLDDGMPYLAMEWLEGEDLQARMRRAPLTMRQSLVVARQIAAALEAAHKAGVVHRDVKPTNVFLLNGSGPLTAKLVDFGVASMGDVRLTQRGHIVGTPAYMAPEQARGEGPVDSRCDLYALGATLFELLTGRPPHVGPTPIATLARLVTSPAPRLREFLPDVMHELDELEARLLATYPDERPASATQVASELDAMLVDPTIGTSLPPPPVEPSSSLTSGAASRLVTTVVALRLGSGAEREEALTKLRERGGDAVPFGSDGVIAHFGVRQALGDEAARAVDMGRELAATGAKVGVATGRSRVHLTRPVGEVVDRASAFAREAQGGQTLADTTTAELVRGRFEMQQRGDGVSVVGAAMGDGRPDGAMGGAPFVGREAELAQIASAYERCVEDQTPVVVSCTGAPGIGKSRLSREVLTRLAAGYSPPRLVVVRCDPFATSQALGVAADTLRALLGLDKTSTLDQALAAIAGLTPPGQAPVTSHNHLARLLANKSLDAGPGARDALWLAMTEALLGIADVAPVAVVLEDAQWADPESLTWLDHALGRSTGRRLWLLVLARPALWKGEPKLFLGRDHVRLELRPISRRAARAIARALLGERASDERLELIASQAAGSPLFAEELARLTAAGRDATKAPTIEAAIQASLDALDAPLREALGRLATFGLTGWDAGLAALGVADAATTLRRLAAADFVVERAESRFSGTREWAFKHALVREVVYAALDGGTRRALHGKAAAWLESVGEDVATIARHYELGGLQGPAGQNWEKAARRSLAANALADAVTLAERALSFADAPPVAFGRALLLDDAYCRLDPRAADRESAVRALLENVHDEASALRAAGAETRYDDARGGGEAISERLNEVAERAASLGLYDEEARCRAALASRLAFAGELAAAEAAAERLLAIARAEGAEQAPVDAWQTLAIVRQTRGELLSALEARRNAARAASSIGLKEREAMLTINVGFALTTLGARQESRAAIQEGIAIAQSIGSPGTVRQGRMVLLCWSAAFGADPTLESELAASRAEADAAAASQWVAPDRVTLGVLFYRGVELLRSGDSAALERARNLLKSAVATYRATAQRDVLPVALGFWAEAERCLGNAEQAASLASQAADLLDAGAPSLLNEAPVYLALHDAHVDAEQLREAKAAIARAMGPFARRIRGLVGTPYARSFLTQLPHNAGLIAAAEAYGLLPREVRALLVQADG
ncbi:MAG TPA: protein kinase [Polyangiaceae bacterium]|nr:protein kinase [Polyangiaceae bacterium]